MTCRSCVGIIRNDLSSVETTVASYRCPIAKPACFRRRDGDAHADRPAHPQGRAGAGHGRLPRHGYPRPRQSGKTTLVHECSSSHCFGIENPPNAAMLAQSQLALEDLAGVIVRASPAYRLPRNGAGWLNRSFRRPCSMLLCGGNEVGFNKQPLQCGQNGSRSDTEAMARHSTSRFGAI